MGQYAVIIALSAILLAGVLLFNARASTDEASVELVAYQADRIAREAAQVGLREVVRDLNNRPGDWTNDDAAAHIEFRVLQTDHEKGWYQVDIDQMDLGTSVPSDPDIVHLTVTGGYDGWNPAVNSIATTDFVLKAIYERGWVDIGVPPSRRKAIETEEDLAIQGNGCVSGDVHANGELSTSGGSFDVLGTGTYANTESGGSWDGDREDKYTGGVIEIEPVPIPIEPIPPTGFDWYQSFTPTGGGCGGGGGGPINNGLPTFCLDPTTAPPGPLVNGWTLPMQQTVTGRGDLGDPYILYINGNLEINGNVVLNGYSQIYVEGAVRIKDNATLSPVNAPMPTISASMTCAERMAAIRNWTETYLDANPDPHPDSVEVRTKIALYAEQDIDLRGTVNVVADLVSNSGFTYGGGGQPERLLIGGVTTQDPITLSGTTMIYYTESDENTQPGGNRNVPNGIRLVSYREWAQRTDHPLVP